MKIVSLAVFSVPSHSSFSSLTFVSQDLLLLFLPWFLRTLIPKSVPHHLSHYTWKSEGERGREEGRYQEQQAREEEEKRKESQMKGKERMNLIFRLLLLLLPSQWFIFCNCDTSMFQTAYPLPEKLQSCCVWYREERWSLLCNIRPSSFFAWKPLLKTSFFFFFFQSLLDHHQHHHHHPVYFSLLFSSKFPAFISFASPLLFSLLSEEAGILLHRNHFHHDHLIIKYCRRYTSFTSWPAVSQD